MELLGVDSDRFDREVLEHKTAVLVDLWAPWCGPCKALEPVVLRIAQRFRSNLKVVKVNIEENPRIAARYSVMSLPTLLLFRQGMVMEQLVGSMSEEKILDKIMPYL